MMRSRKRKIFFRLTRGWVVYCRSSSSKYSIVFLFIFLSLTNSVVYIVMVECTFRNWNLHLWRNDHFKKKLYTITFWCLFMEFLLMMLWHIKMCVICHWTEGSYLFLIWVGIVQPNRIHAWSVSCAHVEKIVPFLYKVWTVYNSRDKITSICEISLSQ